MLIFLPKVHVECTWYRFIKLSKCFHKWAQRKFKKKLPLLRKPWCEVKSENSFTSHIANYEMIPAMLYFGCETFRNCYRKCQMIDDELCSIRCPVRSGFCVRKVFVLTWLANASEGFLKIVLLTNIPCTTFSFDVCRIEEVSVCHILAVWTHFRHCCTQDPQNERSGICSV